MGGNLTLLTIIKQNDSKVIFTVIASFWEITIKACQIQVQFFLQVIFIRIISEDTMKK